MSGAYYNENDPFAAAWLRALIFFGEIAPGDVDERSIEDVTAEDLRGYDQHHFFAGIGVWSYALRQARWPDDRPVWTGSCPCQPFSAAGKGDGFADERHLWPAWFKLIKECKPNIILGEQVASSAAVGKHGKQDVFELWEREAALRVLQDRVEAQLQDRLQRLPQCGCTRVGTESPIIDSFTRQQVSGWGKSTIPGQRATFRSDTRMGSRIFGSRGMRSDRDSLRPSNESGLEHAFFGSTQTGIWLHKEEHPSRPLCTQCGLRVLGRGEVVEDHVGALERAATEIRGALQCTRNRIEEANGTSWFESLSLDLEGSGYAVGASDQCVAGFGGPHIRQRLWYVGLRDTEHVRSQGSGFGSVSEGMGVSRPQFAGTSRDGWLSDDQGDGRQRRADDGDQGRRERTPGPDGAAGGLPHIPSSGRQRFRFEPAHGLTLSDEPLRGHWRGADWLWFRDGKYRPVEPGTFPLAHGAPARVGRLRGYGNAICAVPAQAFIEAVMACL